MSVAEGFEEFVAVVEAGSITAAADQLGLPRPTVSRRLSRLEERLGVRLLHRTTRRLTLTRPGDELYARASRVVESAAAAEAAVRRLDGVPRGLLRVSVPTQMPQALLARWLMQFLEAWPEVRLDLVATDRHPDLVADGVDVAFLLGPVEAGSLVVRVLASDRHLAVASPAYLAAHGAPACPAALVRHTCIVGHRSDGRPVERWPLASGEWLPVSGRLMVGQLGLCRAAALQGFGVTLLPERMTRADVEAGRLVVVLGESVGRSEQVCLAYPERAFIDPKVRAFVDFLSAEVAQARARRFAGAPEASVPAADRVTP